MIVGIDQKPELEEDTYWRLMDFQALILNILYKASNCIRPLKLLAGLYQSLTVPAHPSYGRVRVPDDAKGFNQVCCALIR